MPAKKTKDDFIKSAIKVHSTEYDYSLVEYINSKTKVSIICKEHGIFTQTPNAHLNGTKCKKCSKRYCKTTAEFINECKIIHGDSYNYSNLNYKNNKQKITITCKEHNHEFTLYARSHLSGVGCSKCKIKKYIPIFKKIHGGMYNYDNAIYDGFDKPISIECPIHGMFKQNPFYHMDGCGCPKCGMNISKGERIIAQILTDKGYDFINEHRFEDCKYKNTLPFDFYIPSLNVCIEYDGIQHFQAVDYFGGEKTFKMQLIKDEIKNNYCKNKRIRLIRISSDDMTLIQEKLNGL